MKKQTVCSRCVLDTTVPNIAFDKNGQCQFCKIHDILEERYPLDAQSEERLNRLVERIKRSGKGKPYDCVVGVSGGRDSIYTLHMAVSLGLKPLAVHFDNGWNSEIATQNIHNAVTRLNVDLHTTVADWENFKTLQTAFLKASVSDADVPTDVAIFGTLHSAAAQYGIHYILNGHSFRTEGLMPIGWTYMDGLYIKSVLKRFTGKALLENIPNFTAWHLLYYSLIKRIRVVPILNYINYNHDDVQRILSSDLNWTYYGGHHHESYYTHFFQSYLLPIKFGIDKRKVEYSALVRSGQKNREDALREINNSTYPYDEELVSYVIKKLDLSHEDFKNIMASPPLSFHHYPTYFPLMRALRLPIKWACNINLLPELLYLKYFSQDCLSDFSTHHHENPV